MTTHKLTSFFRAPVLPSDELAAALDTWRETRAAWVQSQLSPDLRSMDNAEARKANRQLERAEKRYWLACEQIALITEAQNAS